MDVSELIERFSIFDDQEERYAYLIELGRKLPAYPEEYRDEDHRVRGCVSRVWLHHEMSDGQLTLYADSDAFIVKGLAAVLHLLYNGKTPEQALAIPIEETFETIGLAGHLTPSRRNGFFSMVERIRSVAAAEAP